MGKYLPSGSLAPFLGLQLVSSQHQEANTQGENWALPANLGSAARLLLSCLTYEVLDAPAMSFIQLRGSCSAVLYLCVLR